MPAVVGKTKGDVEKKAVMGLRDCSRDASQRAERGPTCPARSAVCAAQLARKGLPGAVAAPLPESGASLRLAFSAVSTPAGPS